MAVHTRANSFAKIIVDLGAATDILSLFWMGGSISRTESGKLPLSSTVELEWAVSSFQGMSERFNSFAINLKNFFFEAAHLFSHAQDLPKRRYF